MANKIPTSGHLFLEMMKEIDTKLSKDKVPIPNRPMQAIMVIGIRYKIAIPLTRPPNGAPTGILENAKLSESVNDWFQKQYGDRLKIDMSVGRMVISINGDLYALKFPRIFGAVHFVLSKDFIEMKDISSSGPVLCNILQLVDNLTPDRSLQLSDSTIYEIGSKFELGLHAFDILEASQDSELIRIARGDIQTAIANLLDRTERYGESKWASLQAAEKTLKAAIALEGAKFKFSHSLAGLCQQIEQLGVNVDYAPLINKIQCTAGIRYGEEKCTRDEALEAHQASLELAIALYKGGAKFRVSLDVP